MTNIWSEIICIPSLKVAFEKVKDNKGCAGEDGVTIADFQKRLHSNLTTISHQLQEGTYEQGEYLKVTIPKKSGAIRTLMIPTIRDRIVHTAIAKKLTPILEPLFENCSFAYRPGRSVKQAIAKIEYWRNDGYTHVIEADIKDYFNSINHKSLLSTLVNCFDKTVQHSALIDFLESEFSHQANELNTNSRGLVQGSPLSPLLANLYLDRLDEAISDKGVKIVRFADDFVLLCKKPHKTEKALVQLQQIITSLGLELNMDKTKLVSFDEGFEFLGYMFVRSLAVKKSKDDRVQNFIQKPIDEPPVESIKASKSTIDQPPSVTKTKNVARHALGDRILYVIEKGRKIHSDNNSFHISTPKGNEVMSVATNRVDRIVIGTNIELNRDLINHCSTNNISLNFVNGWGETKARLITPEDDHAALQFAQAQACADITISTKLALKVVDARIRNQRTQLLRLNRKKSVESVSNALRAMKYNLRKLEMAETVSIVRGLEGASGALYWPALAALCAEEQGKFKRTRPAKTPLYATINYLTYMLERDIRSALRFHGLHCGFGFLHTPKDYSQSAVYDMMEAFRAPLTEGLAIFLFNSKRLQNDMFSISEEGAVRINRKAQRAIIKGYESAVARRVNVTGKKYKLGWRLMMRKQASDLAKAYRKSDVNLFQPYLMEA